MTRRGPLRALAVAVAAALLRYCEAKSAALQGNRNIRQPGHKALAGPPGIRWPFGLDSVAHVDLAVAFDDLSAT